MAISDKLCRHRRIDRLIHRHIRPHIVRRLAGFAGLILLLLHTRPKSFFVNRKPSLIENLFRQVKRESISII